MLWLLPGWQALPMAKPPWVMTAPRSSCAADFGTQNLAKARQEALQHSLQHCPPPPG